MPGIVNKDDLSALAAEYVIGTLDPNERARANAMLDADEGFRALVRAWERRLGELHLMVEPVEPDGRILDRIRDRLGVRAPAPPPLFAPVAATPAAAPVSAPFSATTFSAPVSTAPSAPAFEPLMPQAPPSPPPLPPPLAPRTPEQELASLIEEADKFTTQLNELASKPSLRETGQESGQETRQETGQEARQETGQEAEETGEGSAPPDEAASHVESLLAEAADAIASKARPPAESDQVERVEDAWPEQIVPIEDLPPPIRGPRRDATMLMSPTDVAHLTVRRQQRRIDRWRATALLMTFLAFGLGTLIAAWRLAPDRLPQRLQPIAVLGLGEWSPSERVPAEHGTQFEE